MKPAGLALNATNSIEPATIQRSGRRSNEMTVYECISIQRLMNSCERTFVLPYHRATRVLLLLPAHQQGSPLEVG
jgi:hypothetical protein